jgi:hypothetical protein
LESGAESLVDQNIGSQGFKKAAKFRREWLAKLKRKPICAKIKGSWQNRLTSWENILVLMASQSTRGNETRRGENL